MGNRLYVGNLPYDADEDTIRAAFSEGGRTVVHIHIPLDRETQRPRGFAFIEMGSDDEAQQALKAMDGASMGTRSLRVSEAEERRPAGSANRTGGPRPTGDRSQGGAPSGNRQGGDGGGGDGGGGDGGGDSSRVVRERRFGPDAKPARFANRERSKRGHGRRRNEDSGNDSGRRGGSRYGDGSDYDY